MRSTIVLMIFSMFVPVASALEPDDPALVGVWLFDEGDGDQISDLINENTGFMATEDDFEWGEGKFGSAVTSFGPGAIDVDESDSLASIEDGVTVAAWFRIDADSDTGVRKQGAFLLEDQSASEPVPDGFSFRFWTDQGISPGFYGTTELEQGEWYHLAGTYDADSGVVELYVNGEPESENGGALSDANAEWDPEWGGVVQPGSPLQLKYGPESLLGGIDEVVILSRAISGDEVKQLLNGWASIGGAGVDGDIDGDGDCDTDDIEALAAGIRAGNGEAAFDANGDGTINALDLTHFVQVVKNTWIGDANLDGEFSSSDLVAVFQSGKFESNEAATWAQGDWTGDGLFNSSDFVAAFQDGGFEMGPKGAVASVPEPSSLVLLAIGLLAVVRRRR